MPCGRSVPLERLPTLRLSPRCLAIVSPRSPQTQPRLSLGFLQTYATLRFGAQVIYVALLAAGSGRGEDAFRLLGAADALRADIGSPRAASLEQDLANVSDGFVPFHGRQAVLVDRLHPGELCVGQVDLR